MSNQSFLINLNRMTGSEVPLRSVRRTIPELKIIKFAARHLYSCGTGFSSQGMWKTHDNLIVYEAPHDTIAIVGLDKQGIVIQDHMIVLIDDHLYRNAEMSENMILKAIQDVANYTDHESWKPVSEIQAAWIFRNK